MIVSLCISFFSFLLLLSFILLQEVRASCTTTPYDSTELTRLIGLAGPTLCSHYVPIYNYLPMYPVVLIATRQGGASC